MAEEPRDIEQQIAQTRRELGADVDALADKTSPSRIVERQVSRTRRSAMRLKDRVMGTTSDAVGGAGQGAQSATRSVQGATSSMTAAARRGAEGNPLAAGMIAFGVGWLVSSLIPASGKEKQVAGQIEEVAQDVGQPVGQAAGEAAKEVADRLREPAQQAVAQVRDTATGAVETVQQEGKYAAGRVGGQTRQAGEHVRQESTSQ